VLSAINSIIAGMGANIRAQNLSTLAEVGYLIVDIDKEISDALRSAIDELETSIKTRILF
jgi:D-3-phosphoglycerate dehydrogenase